MSNQMTFQVMKPRPKPKYDFFNSGMAYNSADERQGKNPTAIPFSETYVFARSKVTWHT